MRTLEDVEEYDAVAFHNYVSCCKICGGVDIDCSCREKHRIAVAAYEACIPQSFWWNREEDTIINKEVFSGTIKPYIRNMNKALRNGYGLILSGDNGVGKTHFISYILISAIKSKRTVYYTSMLDLDFNIKRGFRNSVLEERLNWMLDSDFLAIDELGKEKTKSTVQYMDTQIERILKSRIDNNLPILFATNVDVDSLDELYGATVASMLSGKFQVVTMEPGDLRKSFQYQMRKEMGYES